MAQYPIKMLKDENGTPFVPLVAPEAVKDNQGTDWQALIDKKLEKTNIIAGDNITLSVSGNDITINSQAGGASDYSDLTNKPKINNVELSGNKSLSDFGITNNVLDGKALGSARTLGAKDSGGQPLGKYAWAEGKGTIASGEKSHAEGSNTTASGAASHAEGNNTKASGNYSHAGVKQKEASGTTSHAEGYITIASGTTSHAEGWSTIAQGDNQHVQGKYNISDTTSAHIVGNGSSDSNKSNAHTLDWQGNAWFAGDVYTGSTSGKNKDEGSKILATKEYVDSKTSALQGHVIENMLDTVIFRLSNLDNKSEFRFFGPSNSGVTDLGLSFEDVSLTSGDKFEMSATFQTASSGCTFEITESTSVKVKLTGDDVTNGVLNPVADKVYEIAFYWNGFFMSGVVRGVDTRNKITITNSAKADLGMDLYVFSDEGCTNIIGTIAAWGESQEFAVDGNLIYAGYKKTDAASILANSSSGCTPTLISNSTYHAYKIEITSSPASIDLRGK